MKNELAKSPINIFQSIMKTSVSGNLTPKEKYIPSQETIEALETAYKKKVNEKK